MDIAKLTGLLTAARQTGEDAVAQAAALVQSLLHPAVPAAPPPSPAEPNEPAFLALTYTAPAGSRPYRLYVPGSYDGRPRPLVVMLHGCAQSAEDFAAGTRMNSAAEAAGCFVLYPEQTQSANISRFWNWFNAADQQRGEGEPGLVAGMVGEVADKFAIDPARIYAAGLSAGGAAAAVLGAAYPDLFAAIGVHSGLACGAARDMQSGFAAMGRPAAGRKLAHSLPAIVFHGDRDSTVHPGNADAVIDQARARSPVVPRVTQGAAPGGRAFTRTDYLDSFGTTLLEHWVVLGGGHAWSGGSSAGSFTDPSGPDASAEMLRFFLEHPKR